MSSIKDLIRGLEEILEVEAQSNLKKDISPLALIIVTSLIIISALISNSLTQLLALGGINVLIGATLRIRLKKYLIKSAVFALIVFILSIPSVFFVNGTPLFTLNVRIFVISISSEGLCRVALFVLRALVCVGALTLSASVLGIDGILNILAKVRAPKIILQMVSLTYRYIFVSIDEAQKMLLAREARRYRIKKFINLQDLRDLGKVLAALFMRTYERSERVYLAMKARGFTMERAGPLKIHSPKSNDLLLILAVSCGILLVMTSVA